MKFVFSFVSNLFSDCLFVSVRRNSKFFYQSRHEWKSWQITECLRIQLGQINMHVKIGMLFLYLVIPRTRHFQWILKVDLEISMRTGCWRRQKSAQPSLLRTIRMDLVKTTLFAS